MQCPHVLLIDDSEKPHAYRFLMRGAPCLVCQPIRIARTRGDCDCLSVHVLCPKPACVRCTDRACKGMILHDWIRAYFPAGFSSDMEGMTRFFAESRGVHSSLGAWVGQVSDLCSDACTPPAGRC